MDKGHGRVEKRTPWVTTWLAESLRGDRPGCEQVFLLRRERRRGGEVEIATHFGITSLPRGRAGARELLTWTRAHWGIENGLHFIEDRWWDEDRQWSRRAGLAELLATLRDAVLTALRLIPGVAEDLPIRARADHLGRNLRKALSFIGARK